MQCLTDRTFVYNASFAIATTSCKWASMNNQQFLVLQPGQCVGCATVLTHDQSLGHLYWQQCIWRYGYRLQRITVNRVLAIFVGAQLATQHSTKLHRS